MYRSASSLGCETDGNADSQTTEHGMKADEIKKAADELRKIADVMHRRRNDIWNASRVGTAGIHLSSEPETSDSDFLYRIELDVRCAMSLLYDALDGGADD